MNPYSDAAFVNTITWTQTVGDTGPVEYTVDSTGVSTKGEGSPSHLWIICITKAKSHVEGVYPQSHVSNVEDVDPLSRRITQ